MLKKHKYLGCPLLIWLEVPCLAGTWDDSWAGRCSAV